MLLIWEPIAGKFECVRFDVVRSFSVSSISQVTEHPTEGGSPVSDHAIEQPETISFEAVITNTPYPVQYDPSIRERFPGILIVPAQPIDHMARNTVSVTVRHAQTGGKHEHSFTVKPGPLHQVTGGGDVSPRSYTVELGQDLERDSKIEAKVWESTDYHNRIQETYEALRLAKKQRLFVRVETDRVGDVPDMQFTEIGFRIEKGKGVFSIGLKAVNVVNSQTVQAPQPLEPMGKPKKAVGSKSATEDSSEKDKEKKKSLAIQAYEGLAGLLGS